MFTLWQEPRRRRWLRWAPSPWEDLALWWGGSHATSKQGCVSMCFLSLVRMKVTILMLQGSSLLTESDWWVANEWDWEWGMSILGRGLRLRHIQCGAGVWRAHRPYGNWWAPWRPGSGREGSRETARMKTNSAFLLAYKTLRLLAPVCF